MARDDFLRLLDELFELDEGTITGSETLKEIPEWSSLTFIGLISMVDEHCGVMLAPDAVLACGTVNDLADLVLGSEAVSQQSAA